MKERKHNYLVGFVGENQVAYGKDQRDTSSWVELMTLHQAKGRLKKLHPTSRQKVTIYKLVPVRSNNNAIK